MKEIQLTQGQVAVVDDWWFEELNQYKWYAKWDSRTQSFRAMRGSFDIKGEQKIILMHGFIMGTPSGMVTDHINHNTLDNREENLRVCTNSQNMMNHSKYRNNTSGYKGVDKITSGWRAQIQSNKKKINLGTFTNPEEAAKAYDIAATRLHGEFALINFPTIGDK